MIDVYYTNTYDNFLNKDTLTPPNQITNVNSDAVVTDQGIDAAKIANLNVGTITVSTWGYIRSGKTSFTDAVNAGYYFSTDGLYVWSAGDATKLKYSIATWAFDYVGTISGRATSTIASSINSSGNLVSNVINTNLDTSAKQILWSFTFWASGAIAMNTDANNGLWISPGWLLGKNAGVTTFAIDTLGNATFKWDITGSTGTFWSVTINSGTIQWSTVAGTTNAPANNATVGATLWVNVSGGGTWTNQISNAGYITTITGNSITTGTITVGSSLVGLTVNTGWDIVMNSDNWTSYSEIIFNTTSVADKGWNLFFTATGWGGFQAGDFQFLPQTLNASSVVRLGMATVPCHLVVHGGISGGTVSGGSVYVGSYALTNPSGTLLYWNGSPIGGSTDLTNCTTNVTPDTANTRSVGTSGKPWLWMYSGTYYLNGWSNSIGFSSSQFQFNASLNTTGDFNCTSWNVNANRVLINSSGRMRLPVGSNLY